tara:strand:- start:19 stop:693 length:675 start_codon:yes stop_codon:yes gene_type:complete
MAKSGQGMKGLNAGVSGNPTMKDELTGCAGAVVGMVESLEGSRKNQKVICRMGAPDDLLTISCAWSLAVGDIICIAPVGAVLNDSAVSVPQILDEQQLGWGADSNSAVLVNKLDLLPGDAVPSTKPEKKKRAKQLDKLGNEIEEEGADALFETKVKLTKEEKALQKAEKAKQKAIKAGTWVEPEVAEVELKKASKKEVKDAKRRAKAKSISTEDELELAGLCLE